MAISFKAPEPTELRPRITVMGVGGAGGNAVNNMITTNLEGVDFIVANTDAQALTQSKAEKKIQLGVKLTEGLGAGAQPDVGKAGAEESLEEILEYLTGTHMVFITAGMGGGTGTGAAPVIARAVREAGILTVGVVTKPFAFEGERRMRMAEKGIAELQQYVHTLIVIPNQNLFRVASDRTTFAQAFEMADDVLSAGVRGVTDLIVMPGMINLDFADIKSVIAEMGKAMMGTGEAEGEDRAKKAAELAISNPLLDDVSMKGAKGVLINITGGSDLTLFEVEQAANQVRAEVDPDANIIFGNTILPDMEGKVRVSVVATGIDAEEADAPMPKNVEPLRPHFKPIHPASEEKAEPARANASMNFRRPPVAEAARPGEKPVTRNLRDAEEAPAAGTEAHKAPAAPARPAMHAEAKVTPKPESVSRPAVRSAPAPTAREEAPKPEKRGWFLGRRRHNNNDASRHDIRQEPSLHQPSEDAPAARQVSPQPENASPAASVSPVRSRLAAEPHGAAQPAVRPVPEPENTAPKTSGSDLFADQSREDQFEIPAFLRRQQN